MLQPVRLTILAAGSELRRSERSTGFAVAVATPHRRVLRGWCASAVVAIAAALASAAGPARAQAADPACPPLLRHSAASLQTGEPRSLCQYRGKVLLIVNTASYCGYTRQYEGLEALYRQHRDRGLVVLGFPSNDFGAQEPGSNREIAEFCRTTYGVEFPMFEKQAAGALAAQPLFAELIRRSGEAPRWNFHKYLIDRSGQRVRSFGSAVEPGEPAFVRSVQQLLAEKPPG